MSDTKKFIVTISNLINEWDWEKNAEEKLDPYKLTHGSTKKAHWVCPQGHNYTARIDHRTVMNSGCPYCAGKLPILGENDLATLYPSLLEEWDYEKMKNLQSILLLGRINLCIGSVRIACTNGNQL